ncbi:MAG: hypothetical protein HY981_03530 [Candidatus Magasanikbacteria bacterium]|nr:hypothetical protein [Candidatus Magasanikbacteria bacterium]
MKFIYHLFGTIFFVVWAGIGLVLLVSGFALAKAKPWQGIAPMMSALSSEGFGGKMSGLGGTQLSGIQEMMQKMGQFGTVKGFYDSLKPAEKACLAKQLGEKNLADILANPQYKPTPDVVLKGVQCLNTK